MQPDKINKHCLNNNKLKKIMNTFSIIIIIIIILKMILSASDETNVTIGFLAVRCPTIL